MFNDEKRYRYALIGPEKTGTHLVMKLLRLLGISLSEYGPSSFIGSHPRDFCGFKVEDIDWFGKEERIKLYNYPRIGFPKSIVTKFLDGLNNNEFSHSHVSYNHELSIILQQLNYSIILVIRDPRDQVLSMADWFGNPKAPKNIRYYELGSKSHDSRVHAAIYGYHLSDKQSVDGVKKVYEKIIPWRGYPRVLTLRFEDLVGSKGGGNDKIQLEQIEKVADFLRKPLSRNDLLDIASKLYGNTHTFRKGTIGSWKQRLNEIDVMYIEKEMKVLMKEFNYS